MSESMVEPRHLLVVSRGPGLFHTVSRIAEASAWRMERATSPWDAIERVQSGVAPHVLLLETAATDRGSLYILRWMRRFRPDLPVIVVCDADDESGQKEAIQLGADAVLVWPLDPERLESAIGGHLAGARENVEVQIESDDIEAVGEDEWFLSASPAMQKLRAQAELLAQTDAPVLILGELGCGKRTVARLIHKLSVRSGFDFLRVHCAEMPAELLEIELFGRAHAGGQGAGNWAGRFGAGKLEAGRKGTLLLEEITEMPLGLQARLVQFLQERQGLLPGEDISVAANVRILAATGAKLDRALAEKRLREDLYYRLSAFTVHVPPLRQRKDEIKVLLRYSMHKLSRHYGLAEREFTPAILDACVAYSWPGNLQELDAFVKRYLIAGDKEGILIGQEADSRSVPAQLFEMPAAPRAESGDAAEDAPESLKLLVQSVKSEAERNAIAAALEKTAWNRKAAARLLKVSYRTLLYKIEQYHMSAPVAHFTTVTGTNGRDH